MPLWKHLPCGRVPFLYYILLEIEELTFPSKKNKEKIKTSLEGFCPVSDQKPYLVQSRADIWINTRVR